MKKDFAKKLGAYTLAAGAAAAVATQADAAMMVYDNGGAGWFDASPHFAAGRYDLLLLQLDGTVLVDDSQIDPSGITSNAITFVHDGYWVWGDGKARDGLGAVPLPGAGVTSVFWADGYGQLTPDGPGAYEEVPLTQFVDIVGPTSPLGYWAEGSGAPLKTDSGMCGYGWYSNVGNFWGRGFMGMYIDDVDGRHYGWADVQAMGSRNDIMLHSFAFSDTPDMPVFAGGGEVPEPVTLSLLALGATGLLARRKRA